MITNYIVNGFMDSGKTTFIKDWLEQDYFKTGERTMLLVCEEGDEEYDEELLQSMNVFLVELMDEEDLLPENIQKVEKEIKPSRVIIELNGMWKRESIEFPWYWDPPIEVAVFDATTFEMYSRNMKSLVAEQIKTAVMVMFNRCDTVSDKLASFRRNVKAVNSTISVVFEDKNGALYPQFEEDLPYDLASDTLEITDESYGIFYLDAMENVDRYVGKAVELFGMVMKNHQENSNSILLGRFVMTCCEQDLSIFGFICDFDEEIDFAVDDWIRIKATVEKDFAEKYNLYFPVLHVDSYEKCEEPENKVIERI